MNNLIPMMHALAARRLMRSRLDNHTLFIELTLVHTYCLTDEASVGGPGWVDAFKARGAHVEDTPVGITGWYGTNVNGRCGTCTARACRLFSGDCCGIDERQESEE